MVRDKSAIICRKDWTVGDSRSEGRKMVNRAIRLTLRAFNNEWDVLISKVNWKNVNEVKKRIGALNEALDKLNESLSIEITSAYLSLKFHEAELVSEEKIRKEQEREKIRAEREAEREEAKAQQEIQAEMRRQEIEERKKVSLLESIRSQLGSASDEHRLALEKQIEELEKELSEAAAARGRLIAMAEHTRIGHVYVVSNRGAFGDRMIKVGMTRRLEPLDRVKELGDASVPFPFDLHAMIFSEDAPALERELHEAFEDRRTNKINRRKEYFFVSLDEIHAELNKRIPGLPFEFEASSLEYVASIQEAQTKPKASVADQFADTI